MREVKDALLNIQGLIDTPVAKRLFGNSLFYQDVIKSLHKALEKIHE